uniref:Protein pianissimo A n=1 Tax=Lygus hesperus TaxID=30085 RepID=A0A0A9W2H0_LYGHE
MLQDVCLGTPRLLTSARVGSLVGRALLRMTGKLSAFAHGLQLMHTYGLLEVVTSLFDHLQPERLTCMTSMDPKSGYKDTLHEVCVQLMHALHLGSVPNYGVCDALRLLVKKCLKSCSRAVRLAALLQIKRAIRKDLSMSWQ